MCVFVVWVDFQKLSDKLWFMSSLNTHFPIHWSCLALLVVSFLCSTLINDCGFLNYMYV